MKRINAINFSKTMIFFSLVVFFSGVAFDFNNNRKLLNPKNDTYLLAPNKSDDGTISITTIDQDDINGGKPIGSDNNGSSQSKVVDLGDISSLRSSIQIKFGISVKYGSETDGYKVSDLSAISLSDSNDINDGLSKLYNDLSMYPVDLFKEMKKDGYNLTIYLIKKYDVDNVTGVTDSNGKNVIISLATDYQFKESLHHEIYHYMENYMYTKGAKFTIWDNLNPVDFKYGKHNPELSFSYTQDSNSYFVNNYAQTAADEDRASTFEYMTADGKSSCLENGKPIWLKAKYMCEQIDAVFDSVSPEKQEFWERYVY